MVDSICVLQGDDQLMHSRLLEKNRIAGILDDGEAGFGGKFLDARFVHRREAKTVGEGVNEPAQLDFVRIEVVEPEEVTVLPKSVGERASARVSAFDRLAIGRLASDGSFNSRASDSLKDAVPLKLRITRQVAALS